jgi:hypothetical protein
MIFKHVSIKGGGGGCCDCDWFRPSTFVTGQQVFVNVEPGVIYRSFNLKDMMVYTGYIDNSVKSLIQSKEGTLSGHAINGLMENIQLQKDTIVYLEIGVGPNLYPTGAVVKVSKSYKDDIPWSGYPEPFIYDPPLKLDSEGIPTGNFAYRRQIAAIVPIAYLTNDLSQDGEGVSFGQQDQQVMVRVLCNNLMMHTFIYDGQPVAYPLEAIISPFFNYYNSSSTSS